LTEFLLSRRQHRYNRSYFSLKRYAK